MIIKNDNIPYSYTCLYPCGEENVTFEIQNDFRSQNANFGLSISANGLKFIKDDAEEVRRLIDSEMDYFVSLYGADFQLDLANYEDDGLILSVPLISSGVKEMLSNTTIESLGLSKTDQLAIRKKPQMLFTLAVNGIYGSQHIIPLVPLGEMEPTVVAGVLPSTITLPNQGSYFFTKELPVADSRVIALNYNVNITGIVRLDDTTHNGETHQLRFRSRVQLIGRKSDGTEVIMQDMGWSQPYNNNNYVVGTDLSITITTTLFNYRYAESRYNGDDIDSAYARYDLRFESVMGSTPTTRWMIQQQVTISGEMAVIDYNLPAVSMASIQQALNNQGISIPIISGNYYIASGDIDKLNSTKIIDIAVFFARMKGELLSFTKDSCFGQNLFYYINNPVNFGNNYCKWQKKGFAQDFAVKIGKNPSKVRLKNTPEGMWSNTYTVAQTSNQFKQSEIFADIIYDGAEIVNQLISNSKDVFILDNHLNELTSDDDLPINYSFSAVCVAYNNREKIFSNAPLSANSFVPADTAGVVFTIPNHIAGLTTASSIDYADDYRLSPYIIDADVPVTQAIITQIMNQGFLIAVTINGTEYYVEECSLKVAPHQCHLSLREIIKTPA